MVKYEFHKFIYEVQNIISPMIPSLSTSYPQFKDMFYDSHCYTNSTNIILWYPSKYPIRMLSGNICVEIVLESLTLASLYNSLNMVVIFELVVIFEPDSK